MGSVIARLLSSIVRRRWGVGVGGLAGGIIAGRLGVIGGRLGTERLLGDFVDVHGGVYVGVVRHEQWGILGLIRS